MGKTNNFTPIRINETKPKPNLNTKPNPTNPNCSNLGLPLGGLPISTRVTVSVSVTVSVRARVSVRTG